jgi:tRNA(Arg) A34 adenosine deaminase TadA
MQNNENNPFMAEAIRLSEESVKTGGGPFGAVIVKDGVIIGRGSNHVTVNNDPTAHAEVMAIRDAAANLGNFDLNGCEIYTSCEPCPMCLGAIYWARLSHIYYGNNKNDAARIGFDDQFIYDELAIPASQRKIPLTPLMVHKSAIAFKMWEDKSDKTAY